jgi:hypothetical protein
VVLIHALALVVASRDVVLRLRYALIGGELVREASLGFLSHAIAGGAASLGVALVGCETVITEAEID